MWLFHFGIAAFLPTAIPFRHRWISQAGREVHSGRSKPEGAGLQPQPVEGAARGPGENPPDLLLEQETHWRQRVDTYTWTPNLYSDAPHPPADLVNVRASEKTFKLRRRKTWDCDRSASASRRLTPWRKGLVDAGLSGLSLSLWAPF